MVTKKYELMLIVNPELGEAELETLHDRILGYFEDANAMVFSFKEWGLRRLSYAIKGHKEGRYYLSHFEMDTQQLAPFEQSLKLVEGVLREMVTLLQGDPIIETSTPEPPEAPMSTEQAPPDETTVAPDEDVAQEEDASDTA